MNRPVEFFESTSDSFARQYEADRNFVERFTLWSNLISRFSTAGDTVLDVGCGPGHLSAFAAELERDVVAVDPSPAMLKLATDRLAAHARRAVSMFLGGIEKVRECRLRANLVICSSVLEYIENFDRSLEILAEACVPRGYVIVSLPNAECWYRRVEGLTYRLIRRPAYRGLIKHLLTPEELASRGSSVGLELVESHYCAHHHALRLTNRLAPQRSRGALFVSVLRSR